MKYFRRRFKGTGAHYFFFKDAHAGFFQHRSADIACKNMKPETGVHFCVLTEDHGQRVRFLSRRATCAPKQDFRPFPLCDARSGKCFRSEVLEMSGSRKKSVLLVVIASIR